MAHAADSEAGALAHGQLPPHTPTLNQMLQGSAQLLLFFLPYSACIVIMPYNSKFGP